MPKSRRFICDKCGPLKFVLVDGYAFGDRMLEGLLFKIAIKPQGGIAASVFDRRDLLLPPTNPWIKEAVRYAKQADLLTCPKCLDDIAHVSSYQARARRGNNAKK